MPSALQRGLTFRSLVITIFALLLLGIWVEYQERFLFGGPLVENAPPSGAVAIIVFILLIGVILARFRQSLRITVAELMVVYTAMLVAAPLMTQGLWTRAFALVAAIPHNNDSKSLESLPEMLWPHGKNLVDGRFDGKLNGFNYSGTASLDWKTFNWRDRNWKCPVLKNDGAGKASLSYSIPRMENNRAQMVPGEPFMFTCLLRTQNFTKDSLYAVSMQADDGQSHNLILNATETTPTFSLQSGFSRISYPVNIPRDLKDKLTLTVTLSGPGQLAVQDVQFMNVSAIEAAYSGEQIIRSDHLNSLGTDERDLTIVKPKNMLSVAGLKYLVTGFIPLRQWALPALAWTILIGALFLGFMGTNLLMRNQWVVSERLSFPLNMLPQTLFATPEKTGQESIWRNAAFRLGFALAIVLALYKGLSFYFPQIPSTPFGDIWAPVSLGGYVNNPILKAYLSGACVTLPLTLLAIALVVPSEFLFSIWAGFLLFRVWFVFGTTSFANVPGYPWSEQQHIGGFIGYALLALYVGRQHLWRVLRSLVVKKTTETRSDIITYRTAVAMILASIVLLIGWGVWTGMGWKASLLYFGWMLVCGLTASKIRGEVGMPFGYWMPASGMLFISAIGGFAVFGPTGMLVATIASGFMCVSCFLFIAPVQLEMLELGRFFRVRPKDIHTGLWLGLLGGLFIGGFAFLCWTYGKGGDNFSFSWPYQQNWAFDPFRQGNMAADNAFQAHSLGQAPQLQALNVVANPDAKGLAIGIGITWLLAILRNFFVWFPLHPLGYVLAPSSFAYYVWFTCFVAWAIRGVVLKIGGPHTVRKGLIPFAIGMFLACITSVVFFEIVGFILGPQASAIYNRLP